MKEIVAQTFTPLYDEVEDRIRLIINIDDFYTRVDIMITRALILKLVPLLEDFYDKNYVDDEVYQLDIENSTEKKSGNSTTVSKKDGQLLQSVNLSFSAKEAITIVKFQTSSIMITANFDKNLFKEFTKVLKNAIPKIGWGIGFSF